MSPASHHAPDPAPDAPVQGMPRPAGACWRTVQADDADALARQLTGWEQDYHQLSGGRFHGALTELRLDGLQLFDERISHAVSQVCTVPADALWLGLPDTGAEGPDAAAPIRLEGHRCGHHQWMLRRGGRPFDLVTPERHRIFGIVVGREALQAAAQALDRPLDLDALDTQPLRAVAPAVHAHTLEVLRTVSAHGRSAATQAAAAAGLPSLRSALLDGVVRALSAGPAQPPATAGRHSLARRREVVQRARAEVLAQRDRALTVPELCERVHVSRRTLQYCFEDVLGVGPLQYLRAVRLNGARRDLRQAARRQQSVQDVAVHWGFWHFSQFAKDYGQLFGETPSATRRAAAA